MKLLKEILNPGKAYDRRTGANGTNQGGGGILMAGGLKPSDEVVGTPGDHVVNAFSLDLTVGTARSFANAVPKPFRVPAGLIGGAIGFFADVTVDPIVELGTAAVRAAVGGSKRPKA